MRGGEERKVVRLPVLMRRRSLSLPHLPDAASLLNREGAKPQLPEDRFRHGSVVAVIDRHTALVNTANAEANAIA